MSTRLRVAVVGATGAVGQQLLSILKERDFPISELVPFASSVSRGKAVLFGDKPIPCRVLEEGCFSGVHIAFFDASDAVSREWVPKAAKDGAWVIDNSASFRMEEDIALLVPEVNGEILEERILNSRARALTERERILTGPNCSTVQMVVALRPLRDRWGLKRVVACTYQSVSGAGSAAMRELAEQTSAALAHRPVQAKAFVHPIPFNCIPQIGGFKSDGYTSEERKIIQESRKLLDLPALRITATAVRVPTFNCHAESLNIELERGFAELEEVRRALGEQPGIVVLDDPAQGVYPMGRPSSGKDSVFVGRLRRDESVENGVNLWVVSDNLRKGAALNAIQIGETLVRSLF